MTEFNQKQDRIQALLAKHELDAWNPSITGIKSEDTVLVGETGNEVLTAIKDWPTLPVTVSGQTLARPAILEIR